MSLSLLLFALINVALKSVLPHHSWKKKQSVKGMRKLSLCEVKSSLLFSSYVLSLTCLFHFLHCEPSLLELRTIFCHLFSVVAAT